MSFLHRNTTNNYQKWQNNNKSLFEVSKKHAAMLQSMLGTQILNISAVWTSE